MPLLLFLVWIAAEIVAFVVVGGQIGFLWAVLLVLVVSASGPLLVRRAGLEVLVHTKERLARGESPSRELLDGVVLLLGGFLVCVPGFISDVVGLTLLIGPVRHLVIRAAGRSLGRRLATVNLAPKGRIWTVGGRTEGGQADGGVVDVSARVKPDDPAVDPTERELGDGPGRSR